MSSEINGSKTQIIVAVLALIGVLGGALFANWDKLFNQNQGPTPKPTPVILEKSPTPEINIGGLWRDTIIRGNASEVTQHGSTFTYTARGVACGGRYFESTGSGTIKGNIVESDYQSNFSQGHCSGTVSQDGRQMTSTCTDSVCRQFQSSAVRQ